MVKNERKKRIIADMILIASLLAVGISALVVFLYLRNTSAPAGEGAVVVVMINGERAAEYPLHEDGVYVLNGGTNTITVKDGEVWMSEADCPGRQDCVEKGKINGKVFDSINCLPNAVRVYIEEK